LSRTAFPAACSCSTYFPGRCFIRLNCLVSANIRH